MNQENFNQFIKIAQEHKCTFEIKSDSVEQYVNSPNQEWVKSFTIILTQAVPTCTTELVNGGFRLEVSHAGRIYVTK